MGTDSARRAAVSAGVGLAPVGGGEAEAAADEGAEVDDVGSLSLRYSCEVIAPEVHA